ncbi:5-carboxy-2-oxohept-3-enedioate decarboxylase HpaG1 subunit [Shouchella lonarensis]|uniref:5-carboxy-2-oxohept-3-enedioate decarboxylase HpaG1 subunit n=2 Tax=Shouchella lonarensis TaxID=1464122 RepID=A0A1G6HK17_9BACI|nr:5-carboxy-2-oxohept-3-enedioate decarboxylase HpaG1 subunit [Shouchella lonarensis]
MELLSEENVSDRDVSLQEVVLKGRVYGTLLNDLVELETMKDDFLKSPYKQPPEAPVLYMKPRNTYNEHGQPLLLPKDVAEVQMGATLGIVIGQTATAVKKISALDVVSGFTIIGDVTVPHKSFFRPAVKHRARDGFCFLGPQVIGSALIDDINDVEVKTYVNDQIVCSWLTSNLYRSVAQLLEDVTAFMTLSRGDVLHVGVRQDAPIVRKADRIRIEIDPIGVLETNVVREQAIIVDRGHL